MATPSPITSRVAVVVFAGLFAAGAAAGDRHHAPYDVDIESLKGELWRADGQWVLEIRYDVEVEDGRPALGELELILYVTEHGHVIADELGRSLEFVVPLDLPSEVDDDEIEFESRTAVALPDGAFYDPDDLRLEAVVVRASDGYPLARKGKSIKYDHRERVRSCDVSVGVGVGVYSGCDMHVRVGTHHSVGVERHVRVTHRHVAAESHRVAENRRVRVTHTQTRPASDHRRGGVHHERTTVIRRPSRSGHDGASTRPRTSAGHDRGRGHHDRTSVSRRPSSSGHDRSRTGSRSSHTHSRTGAPGHRPSGHGRDRR